ncbi:MAG: hypothetical protein JNJ88_01265 [Planctomycetes bacterium]|nr:hypothetical protein [Planctomycetota bacterium]
MTAPARLAQAVALIAASALGACAGIEHTVDDLKCVHGAPTSRSLEHQYEVERYGWLAASVQWGFLSLIPTAKDQVRRTLETLEAPADFCFERVEDLDDVNLNNWAETADVLLWAGAIANFDPFPLCRRRALRVVGLMVERDKPSTEILGSVTGDYKIEAEKRLQRVQVIRDAGVSGSLTPELRAEWMELLTLLGRTAYPFAAESRSIAAYFSTLAKLESDEGIRDGLASAARVLIARGALQTLDGALDDSNELVRAEALQVWGRALGLAALPHLRKRSLSDPNPAVRAELAALHGQLLMPGQAAEEDLAALYALTRDETGSVSVAAMDALGRLTGIGPRYDSDFWRQWFAQQGRAGQRGPGTPSATKPAGAE